MKSNRRYLWRKFVTGALFASAGCQMQFGDLRTCLDAWSLVHFATGAALGATIGDAYFPTAAVQYSWELVEPSIWPGYDETGVNRVCDMMAGTAGWAAINR